jgi:hypothetical protein
VDLIFNSSPSPLRFDFVSIGKSNVLINKNGIAVGIHQHKTCGSCRAFVRFTYQLDALRLQLTLQLTNIGESIQFLGITVPAGLKVNIFLSNMP